MTADLRCLLMDRHKPAKVGDDLFLRVTILRWGPDPAHHLILPSGLARPSGNDGRHLRWYSFLVIIVKNIFNGQMKQSGNPESKR